MPAADLGCGDFRHLHPQVDGIEPHHGGDARAGADELADRHGAIGNVSVEGCVNRRVGQRLFGESDSRLGIEHHGLRGHHRLSGGVALAHPGVVDRPGHIAALDETVVAGRCRLRQPVPLAGLVESRLRLLVCRVGLIQPQSRVTTIQLHEHGAAGNPIANVDKRRGHAAGPFSGDIGRFVWHKAPWHINHERDFARSSDCGCNGDRIRS